MICIKDCCVATVYNCVMFVFFNCVYIFIKLQNKDFFNSILSLFFIKHPCFNSSYGVNHYGHATLPFTMTSDPIRLHF